MNLVKAAELLKEIIEKSPELNGTNFLLMIPEIPPPSLTEGYEIIIKKGDKGISEETIEKLQKIAKRENLKIEQMQTSIMLYTTNPKQIPNK